MANALATPRWIVIAVLDHLTAQGLLARMIAPTRSFPGAPRFLYRQVLALPASLALPVRPVTANPLRRMIRAFQSNNAIAMLAVLRAFRADPTLTVAGVARAANLRQKAAERAVHALRAAQVLNISGRTVTINAQALERLPYAGAAVGVPLAV